MKRSGNRASFDGRQEDWEHASSALGCQMNVAVYIPTKLHAPRRTRRSTV